MLRSQTYGPVTRIDLCADAAAEAGRWSACYLVDGVLIDSAMHHGREELRRFVDGAVRVVALTHGHEDHAGGAPALADRARILAPQRDLRLLAEPEPLPPPRELVWGMPGPVRAEALPERVEHGSRAFEVLPTPGHSPGHVAFHHRDEGWVFGGDLVSAIRPRLARREEDLAAAIDSMRRVAALEPARLFLAHLPVPESPLAPLQDALAYLEDRAAAVKGLAGDGAPVAEIVERLFGGEHAWGRGPGGERLTAAALTAGDFSTANLVEKLLAL